MQHLDQTPFTLALSKAGLSAGTTTTYSTANAVNYAIRSKAYTKAAATSAATPTTDANTGAAFKVLSANQIAVVVFAYDVSGNLKCVQGDIQSLDASGTPLVAPSFPTLNTDQLCPFGYVVLKAGSTLSGTFQFGSSNLSGVTGMTYLFNDVIALVDRPQVS